jgi:hypothetical protein
MSKKLVLLIIVIVLLAGGAIWWWFNNHAPSAILDNTNINHQPQLFPSVNGTLVEKDLAESRPYGVMIENHGDARPQSGLDKADIVYETVAEGGITRFLAIFHSKPVSQIGPVRSARDYFAELANEWGVLYAHVGGSDEVLVQLEQRQYKNIDDINEFFFGKYFRRLKSRAAPHNTYTSTGELAQFLKDRGYKDKASFEPWQFKPDATPISQTAATTLRINFSIPNYAVRYEYDPVAKHYNRFVAGKPQLDAETDQQLTATNVLVQYVTITDVPNDPKLRVDLTLTGQGKGVLFSGGMYNNITWNKSKGGKTRYFDSTGAEVIFTVGPTWVELAPTGSLTYQ